GMLAALLMCSITFMVLYRRGSEETWTAAASRSLLPQPLRRPLLPRPFLLCTPHHVGHHVIAATAVTTDTLFCESDRFARLPKQPSHRAHRQVPQPYVPLR